MKTTTVNKYIKGTKKPTTKQWAKVILKNYLDKNAENRTEIEHVIDFLESDSAPLRANRMSYKEAVKGAEKWVAMLGRKGRNLVDTDGSIEVVKTFSKSGNSIVKLISEDAYKREGSLMSHCLTGDTKFITDRGMLTLEDAYNNCDVLNVLTAGPGNLGKFLPTKVNYYGKKNTYNIVLSNGNNIKEIKATSGHRWKVRQDTASKNKQAFTFKTTVQLEKGLIIPEVYSKNVLNNSRFTLSPQGISHGIVFGDGSNLKDRSNSLSLYGKKEVLSKFFSENVSETTKRSIGGVIIKNLPNSYKKLPDLNENVNYLAGFLMGYIATDGHVDKSGGTILSSAKLEHMEYVGTLLQLLGIRHSNIKVECRLGYGKTPSNLYKIRISTGQIPERFYLLDKQAARFKETKIKSNWKVVSVTPTGKREDVYCVTIPETGTFVLEGNILTGNCVGSYHSKTSSIIYSLRDSKNNPHCTIEVETSGGRVYVQQIKGKGNKGVDPKYINDVLDFVNYLNVEINEYELKNLGYELEDKGLTEYIYKYVEKSSVKFMEFKGKRYLYLNSNVKLLPGKEI